MKVSVQFIHYEDNGRIGEPVDLVGQLEDTVRLGLWVPQSRCSECHRKFGVLHDTEKLGVGCKISITGLTDPSPEHVHDWRRNPHGLSRLDEEGNRLYLLRCPQCNCRGWGLEHSDAVTWPKWVGTVPVIEDDTVTRPDELLD